MSREFLIMFYNLIFFGIILAYYITHTFSDSREISTRRFLDEK